MRMTANGIRVFIVENMLVWVFDTPNRDYMIAKLEPFSYHIPMNDIKTGIIFYKISQGRPFEIPDIWDMKKIINGRVFASLGTNTYDITEIERAFIPRL